MQSLFIALDVRIPETVLALASLASLWGGIAFERHARSARRLLLGCLCLELLLSGYLALTHGVASHWLAHGVELGGAALIVAVAACLQRYRYALFGR